jgi:glycosyltransferase involved in cell wall biosynthesis
MAPGGFRAAHPELKDKRIVLFLSRFDRKKGLELLLPAFAEVRREFPDAALALAGSGDEVLLGELKEQARNLGIAENISWTGFLKGEAKGAAFADADVFVLPSWSENFGIAVVEAMAAGCPVVVTDQVAIHGDIAQSGAGYVTTCDSAAIAGALGRVLADSAARSTIGNKGKCLTQIHYSPAAVTSKLVAAYRQIALRHKQ